MIGHRRDALVAACAASAGVHAALVPPHLAESPAAGAAFGAAALSLAAVAVGLTLRPHRAVTAAAAVLLGALVATYVVGATAGVPLLDLRTEGLHGLAVATKVIELAGLALALAELRRTSRLALPIPLAAVIAAASAFAALAVAPAHAGHGHEHPPRTSVSHRVADAH